MSDRSEIAYNGDFWHFLAIFRVENGPQITLLVFGTLFFTQMLFIIELSTKMLIIFVLKWGHMGTVLVFENLLVRYPSHYFILKLLRFGLSILVLGLLTSRNFSCSSISIRSFSIKITFRAEKFRATFEPSNSRAEILRTQFDPSRSRTSNRADFEHQPK